MYKRQAVAEKLKQNYCLELLLLCRDYYTRQERTQMPELSAAPRQEILDAIAYITVSYTHLDTEKHGVGTFWGLLCQIR